jgi:hypothetical protein
MRTVGDLAAYLKQESLSPEELSSRVRISNMTLRRLLKRNPRSDLPEKYQCLLAAGIGPAPSPALQKNFESLLSELEEAGRECPDVTALQQEAKGKLSVANLGGEFGRLIGDLARQATSAKSLRGRALAAGALLYFVNPFDAIPDALPGIGYLDDFAVLTLVAGIIAGGAFSTLRKSKVS